MAQKRLPDLPYDAMSPRQKEIHDILERPPSAGFQGPFPVWIHRPDLIDIARHQGMFIRFGTSLEPRLSELAILVAAEHWQSQYEWFAHEGPARKGGLGEAIIQDLRAGRTPAFEDAEEQAVYDVARSLLKTRALDDATYARAVDILGEGRLVDCVGVIGHYTMVAFTLNAFHQDVPEGAERPFPARD